MTSPDPRRCRPLWTSRVAFVLLALLASIFATAAPAGAATNCVVAEDDSIVIQVNEESASATTVIEMRDGVVFVNDEECGETTISITIIDIGPAKVDRVQLNLGAGAFRADGEAVFVNMYLDDNGPGGARDEVTIRGTKNIDHALVVPSLIQVNRAVNYSGSDNSLRLSMGIAYSDAKFYFLLRAGNDSFRMFDDETDGYFDGFVSIKGGPGADEFIGGPGRQRMRGGSGADQLNGFGGNDLLKGQSGPDFISGGSGADEIHGGRGVDIIRAGKGNDVIDAADGAVDDVYGAGGDDECTCNDDDIVGSIETLIIE